MKDLLSKEQYCYKIHTLFTKSSASPLSIDNPLCELPPFLRENLDPPPPREEVHGF